MKTRYALIALSRLGKEYGKGPVMSRIIASTDNIPQRFLENILQELKSLGYLASKAGKNGGYYLLKHPSGIRMSEIIRHFDGPIALVPCVSEKAYQPCEFCKDEETCKLKAVFKSIRDHAFQILQDHSVADII